jgi:UDP-N-acetylmuramoyl-L-alanyl-D-glutamate--2,6-diaminopimelate ligase
LAAARVAACLHGNPAEKLGLVGITGTNGKTTTASLVRHLLTAAGKAAGSIGTLGASWNGRSAGLLHTTPPAFQFQKLLSRMAGDGIDWVSIEMSSHALDQRRAGDLECDVAVFTHLTRDHLDYHGEIENCFAAKSLLFTRHLKPEGIAVVNLDCPWGQRLAAQLPRVVSWGGNPSADYRIMGDPVCNPVETRFVLRLPSGESINVRSPLAGPFNVGNLVAALAVCDAIGIPPVDALDGLESFPGVPGRMQRLPTARRRIFVDYAHTDDALANVVAAARGLTASRLIVVFGCGGDRDRGKRPKMAAAAAVHADFIVVTSDNPRTEDPEAILDEVEAGIPRGTAYERIADRCAAIEYAVRQATIEDVVVIAGKGHEDYQEIHGIRHPFSDAEVAMDACAELG